MIFYTLRLMEWNNVTNGHNSYFIPLLLLYCVREKMEKSQEEKGEEGKNEEKKT